jgi:hypothetical protein
MLAEICVQDIRILNHMLVRSATSTSVHQEWSPTLNL